MTGIDAEALSQLNDQSWRRLGITQTFDRLLVEAVVSSPGSLNQVRDAVATKLQAGAAKFWELSFPQIKRDLCRRGLLREESGRLDLSVDFNEKITKLLADLAGGVSHVEPTPNVTLEQILEKTAAREAAEKAKKKATTKKKKTTSGEAKPKKRATKKSTASATPKAPSARTIAAQTVSPPNKLFTSHKINKLLDALDGMQLLQSQLAKRLRLKKVDITYFLKITSEMEITRIIKDALMDDEMVELHFRGSELAKTTSADRRKVLISLVKELREAAEKDLGGDAPAEAEAPAE